MGSISTNSDFALTETQKAHFLQHGFVKIPRCFTRDQAAEFTSTLWTRLGMDPNDKSTWTKEKTNMPWHRHVPVSDFAPKAWAAMCELLGGEDRITDTPEFRGWSDGFIVNLGREGYSADDELDLRALDNWHNDGDFFVHFLDSPEQALLVIPLWTDIESKGGGTAYDHPEGTTPWMTSTLDPNYTTYEGLEYWRSLAWDKSKISDSAFQEATGEVGDVYLLHPLMLHSASKNFSRTPRVITNPPVSLKKPFCFDREDPSLYSLVEQKTLRDLGMKGGLKGWKITGERKPWISDRIRKKEEMKNLELERLSGESVG
ncbi:uncharacterized protein RCO7_05074 [Rhynchosporium graminicola]|uniref:Phytanoyl-CoA dioxygenase n=1 Tax=Rhynchosporium graminicola TaxID=2792576 RepID=A0A1E1KDL0_9HELO|nr:uncharacterized protein RCO7_05074 [Rhynchosporium commune]